MEILQMILNETALAQEVFQDTIEQEEMTVRLPPAQKNEVTL
jgi:hypothetical protein